MNWGWLLLALLLGYLLAWPAFKTWLEFRKPKQERQAQKQQKQQARNKRKPGKKLKVQL